MAVLLVVAMFLLIILAEWVLGRRKAALSTEVAAEVPTTPRPRLLPAFVAGFGFSDNVRYHPGHTWALSESPELVRIGLDDFAGRTIGRIDKMTLPKPGRWLRQGQSFVRAFRDSIDTGLVSPIDGVVLQVNPKLLNDPDLARRDPYGEGWLATVQAPDAKVSFRNLIGGSVARRWLEDAAERLRAKLPTPVPALAQDGGLVVEDLNPQVRDRWDEVKSEFFLDN